MHLPLVAPELLWSMATGLCLLAGSWMFPVMSLLCRATARIAKRSAYDRLGGQFLRLGLWLGLASCIVHIALAYANFIGRISVATQQDSSTTAFLAIVSAGTLLACWMFAGRTQQASTVTTVIAFLIAGGLFLLNHAVGAGVVLLCCVLAARKHWAPVVAALVACFVGLTCVAWDCALLERSASGGQWLMALTLDPSMTHVLRSAGVAVCVFSGLACAGIMALIVLLVRRKKDDFGRDYYTLAAMWCATCTAVGASWLTLLWAAAAWKLSGGQPAPSFLWHYAAFGAACNALTVLCWVVATWKRNPLRYKSIMLLGAAAYALGMLFMVNTFVLGPVELAGRSLW